MPSFDLTADTFIHVPILQVSEKPLGKSDTGRQSKNIFSYFNTNHQKCIYCEIQAFLNAYGSKIYGSKFNWKKGMFGLPHSPIIFFYYED